MDAPIRQQRAAVKNTGTVCAHPGCERPRGNGGSLAYCSAHQARLRLGLDMDAPVVMKERGSLVDRVLRRLPAEFGDACVPWPGGRNEAGYGLIRSGGKSEPQVRVTRVVYEHFHGPVPDDSRVVMHTCDNPPCVNPWHLVAGTDGDNMTDKMLKGRAGKKLTPDAVRLIRADSRASRVVAAEHGISHTLVKHIRSRKVWAWVE